MGIYFINPQYIINSQNIINIMTQLVNTISNSIKSNYNIIFENEYINMSNNVNQILNNYLKIYNFYNYGIKYIYVQIYNQNINLVSYVQIKLDKPKYINTNSNWNDFIVGKYNNQDMVIYNVLTQEQKNELNYSLISGNLYFIPDINFTYNQKNTTGILIKPAINTCECNNQNIDYSYITTIYWN